MLEGQDDGIFMVIPKLESFIICYALILSDGVSALCRSYDWCFEYRYFQHTTICCTSNPSANIAYNALVCHWQARLGESLFPISMHKCLPVQRAINIPMARADLVGVLEGAGQTVPQDCRVRRGLLVAVTGTHRQPIIRPREPRTQVDLHKYHSFSVQDLWSEPFLGVQWNMWSIHMW